MFGVLVAVVLLGAGCTSGDDAGVRGAQPATNTPTVNGEASADGSVAVPTRWVTYRSEETGISFPYPEGWYVEEDADEDGASFYPATPPPQSDMPSRLWIDVHDGSVSNLMQQLDGIESDVVIERSAMLMRRIVRRDDLSDDSGLAASYLWEMGDKTYQIGGRQGDPILEYVVDRIEVMP